MPTTPRSRGIAALLQILRPFEAFVRTEALGGTLLILASALALLWANSSATDSYLALWQKPLTVGLGDAVLQKPLILWINDLLMAVFFLLVGLEIKRELLVGELNSVQKAILPALAAVGGMVVPAAIYFGVAHGGPAASGWGVPMATDIAFALGVMRLLGNRVPNGLLVFLAALAIIDDLGAILVIAIFYSSAISFGALGLAAVCTAVLVAMNRFGVRRPALYVLVGLPLWLAILMSGIHATIAGVIVGFCVPATARSKHAESPLSHLEHGLHPYVAFAIVPLFALANAGVVLQGASLSMLLQPASLGVILGLTVGKPIGVIGITLAAVKMGYASLPLGVTLRHLVGAGMLAGIGFTMSLFVAGLGFEPGSTLHTEAKVGILGASILSGLAGLFVLRSVPAPETAVAPASLES